LAVEANGPVSGSSSPTLIVAPPLAAGLAAALALPAGLAEGLAMADALATALGFAPAAADEGALAAGEDAVAGEPPQPPSSSMPAATAPRSPEVRALIEASLCHPASWSPLIPRPLI
jgi:hypothetical protein